MSEQSGARRVVTAFTWSSMATQHFATGRSRRLGRLLAPILLVGLHACGGSDGTDAGGPSGPVSGTATLTVPALPDSLAFLAGRPLVYTIGGRDTLRITLGTSSQTLSGIPRGTYQIVDPRITVPGGSFDIATTVLDLRSGAGTLSAGLTPRQVAVRLTSPQPLVAGEQLVVRFDNGAQLVLTVDSLSRTWTLPLPIRGAVVTSTARSGRVWAGTLDSLASALQVQAQPRVLPVAWRLLADRRLATVSVTSPAFRAEFATDSVPYIQVGGQDTVWVPIGEAAGTSREPWFLSNTTYRLAPDVALERGQWQLQVDPATVAVGASPVSIVLQPRVIAGPVRFTGLGDFAAQETLVVTAGTTTFTLPRDSVVILPGSHVVGMAPRSWMRGTNPVQATFTPTEAAFTYGRPLTVMVQVRDASSLSGRATIRTTVRNLRMDLVFERPGRAPVVRSDVSERDTINLPMGQYTVRLRNPRVIVNGTLLRAGFMQPDTVVPMTLLEHGHIVTPEMATLNGGVIRVSVDSVARFGVDSGRVTVRFVRTDSSGLGLANLQGSLFTGRSSIFGIPTGIWRMLTPATMVYGPGVAPWRKAVMLTAESPSRSLTVLDQRVDVAVRYRASEASTVLRTQVTGLPAGAERPTLELHVPGASRTIRAGDSLLVSDHARLFFRAPAVATGQGRFVPGQPEGELTLLPGQAQSLVVGYVNEDAAGFDLSVERVILSQTVQTSTQVPGVPLVAGRPVFARIFLRVEGGSAPAHVPLRLEVRRAGAVVFAEEFVAQSAVGRTHPTFDASLLGSVATSYNITIPRDVMTPDAVIAVRLTADDAREDNNAWPRPGFPAPPIYTAPIFKTVLVPIRTGRGNVTTFPVASVLANSRELLPLDSIEATVRSRPFETDLMMNDMEEWLQLFADLNTLRLNEAPADVYYHGIVSPPTGGGPSGLGAMPGKIALSLLYPGAAIAATSGVVAHEFGHNLSLGHPPGCNTVETPGFLFPYLNGVVGQYGWSFRNQHVVLPTDVDMMSYCFVAGRQKFISDFSWLQMIRHLGMGAPATLRAMAAAPVSGPVWAISGVRRGDEYFPTSITTLRRAPVLDGTPLLVELWGAQREVRIQTVDHGGEAIWTVLIPQREGLPTGMASLPGAARDRGTGLRRVLPAPVVLGRGIGMARVEQGSNPRQARTKWYVRDAENRLVGVYHSERAAEVYAHRAGYTLEEVSYIAPGRR